jgi:replication factor A1
MATPPVFVKVDQLHPGSNGHTLLAKVLTSKTKTVRRKARAGPAARQTRIECLVGDETGCILFTAPSDVEGMIKHELISLLFCLYYFSLGDI